MNVSKMRIQRSSYAMLMEFRIFEFHAPVHSDRTAVPV